MKRLTWCAGWALIGAAAAMAAPPADNPTKTDNPPKAVSDEEFVKTASAAGMAEVDFGRMAVQQATSPDVKKFAQHMVDDHTKAGEELNKVADKAGIAPSTMMDAKHEELFKKLAALKGADFDHQYVDSQLADHKDAVALFESESKSGKNDDLKAFAAKTLPTLQHHLEMVQKLTGSETDKPPEKANTGNPPDK